MPQVSRITVRGFKSIWALDSFELGGLNVLIGANGAGKSNLMAAFSLFGALAERRLQRFTREQGGPDALLFGGQKRSARMDLELQFANNEGYRISLEPAAGQLIFAREEIVTETDHIETPKSLGTGHDEAELLGPAAAENMLAPYVLASLAGWRVYHFPDTSPSAAVKQSQAVRDNLRLKPDGANLAPFLRRLRESFPDNYRRIVETVRQVAPFFGDFIYRDAPGAQMDLEWHEAGDPDTVRGPGQLSDGTLRFICLAALLLQHRSLQSDTILVDEPELGLHPYAISVLGALMEQVSEEIQLIVSTQSAELVSQLDPANVVVVGRSEGASIYGRLDLVRLEEWLKDYSLGDLWKMNVLGGRPSR